MTADENDNHQLTEGVDRSFHGVLSRANVLSGAKTLASAVVSPIQSISRRDGDAGRTGSAGRATDRGSTPNGEQLLSPRERILALLERNEGRMEQSEIVRTVEWSESTVSRKLGTLEAEGAISRYRIGRGKLVFLPGTEPDCVGSSLPDGEEDEHEEDRKRRPLAA